jgi:hypothetical protein
LNAQKKIAKMAKSGKKKWKRTNPVEHLGCSSPKGGVGACPAAGVWPAQLVDWSFSLFSLFSFF